MKLENLFNVSKTVLKLEDIMWKGDYAQVYIKVKGTFFCFT